MTSTPMLEKLLKTPPDEVTSALDDHLFQFADWDVGPALDVAMAKAIRRFMVLNGYWTLGTTCVVDSANASLTVRWAP